MNCCPRSDGVIHPVRHCIRPGLRCLRAIGLKVHLEWLVPAVVAGRAVTGNRRSTDSIVSKLGRARRIQFRAVGLGIDEVEASHVGEHCRALCVR